MPLLCVCMCVYVCVCVCVPRNVELSWAGVQVSLSFVMVMVGCPSLGAGLSLCPCCTLGLQHLCPSAPVSWKALCPRYPLRRWLLLGACCPGGTVLGVRRSPCPGPGSSWAGPMCLGLQGRNFAMTLPSMAGLVWRRPCRPVTQASLPGHCWHLGLSDSLLWGCPGPCRSSAASLASTHQKPSVHSVLPALGTKNVSKLCQMSLGANCPDPADPQLFSAPPPQHLKVLGPILCPSLSPPPPPFPASSRGGSGWGSCLPPPQGGSLYSPTRPVFLLIPVEACGGEPLSDTKHCSVTCPPSVLSNVLNTLAKFSSSGLSPPRSASGESFSSHLSLEGPVFPWALGYLVAL